LLYAQIIPFYPRLPNVNTSTNQNKLLPLTRPLAWGVKPLENPGNVGFALDQKNETAFL